MAKRASTEHHVVVGTDFSPSSKVAVMRAIRIAADNHARLHVVHGVGRMPAALRRRFGIEERGSDAKLGRIVEQARASNVRATPHELALGATKALRSAARDVGAELIVVGTRGRALPDMFVGSTAERIAALSKFPVLLVRHSARGAYREVIIAADTQGKLVAPLRAARFVSPKAELSVLHAYEAPWEASLRLNGANAHAIASYRKQACREARASVMVRMQEAGLDPKTLVLRHGDPRRILHDTRKDALLVMQRGSVIAHALLGSVTRSVIEHGQSDVLLL
ncbi:MAG TPA: universal stress protein [Labilithrix sp.]|nr:universal stress protein [Labilithrix sp.]